MSKRVLATPWLRCPNCGKVFIGEITYEDGDPWENYTNHCPHCGYTITESEFEEVKQKKQTTMTIKELKEAMAYLPDTAQVVVDTIHSEFEWEDARTEDVRAVSTPKVRLTIIAKIKDVD